ncbi:MAG: ABC transporter permease, partial [Rhizobiales bacterium]|nr:ABC transporter permease [Hyphomicrobiales bacterium]
MSITRLVIGRVLSSLVTLVLVSLLIFSVLEILPGDVATRVLGRDATPESLATVRERLNLDDPAHLR